MFLKGILFFFLVLLISQNIRADTLNVIGIPGAPYRYFSETQEIVGFDIDILDEIMDKLGIEYQVTLLNSSTRLTQMWQSPDVDMVFTLSQKAERQVLLTYADEPHLNLTWNFFIKKENKDKIFYRTLDDLAGLKVGATSGFAYTPEFWQAAKEGVFTLDTVVNNNLNLNKLLHGRFDTFASNTNETLYRAKIAGLSDDIIFLDKPLKQKPYYNTFVKASNYAGLDVLIQQYNTELKRMKQDGRYQAIYQYYFGKNMAM